MSQLNKLTAIFCYDIKSDEFHLLMKITKRPLFLAFILVIPFLSYSIASEEKQDPWKNWLNEVKPIMTRAELSVFKSLQTEEDRRRFQKLFWQVRDPTPQTPQNEYVREYYSRRQYAESELGGVYSDRGQIYVLMGKPKERHNFAGYEDVVDCELWIYQSEGRPGLPPFMYLLFYRPHDMGVYKLYYPGLHSPLDILSESYAEKNISKVQGYNILKESFPDLAAATLSVLPEVGTGALFGSSTASAHVLSQIYTLPEREVKKSYLKNFASGEGIVAVDYSTKEIAGKGQLFISEDRGFKFLNYSLLPDAIQTAKTTDTLDTARIVVTLRVEDSEGRTIHQQEREFNLNLDQAQKKAMEERKMAFNDFAPIIPGKFSISVAFSNQTTKEFFVYKEQTQVSDKTLPVLVGYKVKEVNSSDFCPLRMGNYKVLSDPRSLYYDKDSIEGLIFSEEAPEIFLVSKDDEKNSFAIQNIEQQGKIFIFKHPLKSIKPGNYVLRIRTREEEVYDRTVSVLSFQIEKPLELERTESYDSHFNYAYLIGQEYLNKGDVEAALEQFKNLPEQMWNSTTLPVIARAFYQKKDYARVVGLLEKENIIKNYPVLILLGNSCLELKKYQKAAEYFEELRKYGDTVENNRILGAIYYSLGEREKAQVCYDRAKKLEEKLKDKNSEKKKEPSDSIDHQSR